MPSTSKEPGVDPIDAKRDMLVYDGACPVCSQYVIWTNLRQAHPGIRLIDARTHPQLVATLRAEGVEINDTMMLQIGGERFTGAAAMAKISDYVEPDSTGRRLLRGMTRSEGLLRPVYPILVRARKLLLRLIGRDQIS